MGEQESTGAYPPGLYRVRDAETGEFARRFSAPDFCSHASKVSADCCAEICKPRSFTARHWREEFRNVHGTRNALFGIVRWRDFLNPQNRSMDQRSAAGDDLSALARSRGRSSFWLCCSMKYQRRRQRQHVRLDPLAGSRPRCSPRRTLAITWPLHPHRSGAGAVAFTRFDLGAGVARQKVRHPASTGARWRSNHQPSPARDGSDAPKAHALEAQVIHPRASTRRGARRSRRSRRMAVPARTAALGRRWCGRANRLIDLFGSPRRRRILAMFLLAGSGASSPGSGTPNQRLSQASVWFDQGPRHIRFRDPPYLRSAVDPNSRLLRRT